MIILAAIAVAEAILLAGVIWSAVRRPIPARARFVRRADDMPHAL